MKTPRQLENHLAQNAKVLHAILIGKNLEGFAELVKESQEIYSELRKAQGFKSSGEIFSQSISKLNKDETTILGVALLPEKHSGIANLCAFADSCAHSCVAFSGNGSFPTVYRARLARTQLLTDYPLAFLTLLVSELQSAYKKAQTYEKPLAVRLNTYSDIRWEVVVPWLFDSFRAVKFYDYTKHTTASRPEESRPANYHLTYSVSERTSSKEVGRCADIGRPLAVVVATRSGHLKGSDMMRPIPKTWAGMPTIDGDISDARWTTPTGSVVILRRKHTLATNAPMITHAQQLEKGIQE